VVVGLLGEVLVEEGEGTLVRESRRVGVVHLGSRGIREGMLTLGVVVELDRVGCRRGLELLLELVGGLEREMYIHHSIRTKSHRQSNAATLARSIEDVAVP